MKRILSVKFSRAVDTYDSWAVPQRYTAQKLSELLPYAGTLLDVGCGTGTASRFMLKKATSLTGIDISPSMARAYSTIGRAVVGDAENLPFRDKSFDTVLSNFSLHWTDVSKSVREAIRVAKKNLLISLPVEGSLEGLDFPYPSEGDVLGAVYGYRVLVSDIREVEIPFRGWELVKFFHYTGSSTNPTRKKIMSKRAVEDILSALESPSFRVLFLYVEL